MNGADAGLDIRVVLDIDRRPTGAADLRPTGSIDSNPVAHGVPAGFKASIDLAEPRPRRARQQTREREFPVRPVTSGSARFPPSTSISSPLRPGTGRAALEPLIFRGCESTPIRRVTSCACRSIGSIPTAVHVRGRPRKSLKSSRSGTNAPHPKSTCQKCS
jgi:hypothetical protein